PVHGLLPAMPERSVGPAGEDLEPAVRVLRHRGVARGLAAERLPGAVAGALLRDHVRRLVLAEREDPQRAVLRADRARLREPAARGAERRPARPAAVRLRLPHVMKG